MELNSEQWLRVKEIVASALELAPDARDAFVPQACLGDEALIQEVLSLLSFDDPSLEPETIGTNLAPGTLLNGRYLIQRELGKGGFATTYLAQDRQLLNRRVVVKVLTSTETDPYILRKFHDELQALSSLEHPNIVAPLDSGLLPNGAPFIVMQFAEGRTLRSLLSEGRIPLARAGSILTQLARTLAFIHAKGIYHRDLKPENIIVQTYEDGSDHVRLIDFGIASIVERGTIAQTRIVGSLSYMAPEQFTGQVNPQTDIYAFGVVAYEAITGVLPFRAGSHIELMQIQREGNLIKPTQFHPQLNPDAERLILQALAFQSEKRPTNTAGFADQLGNIPWTAHTPGAARRARWLWLIFLVPLAILAGWWVFHAASRRSEQPQTLPLALPLPPASSTAPEQHIVTVELTKQHAELPTQLNEQGVVQLPANEDFRFSLSSFAAGHAYIFSLGGSPEKLHILFPSRTSYDGQSAMSAGQPLSIPEKTWFKLDRQPETETVFFVWSNAPQPDLEAAIQWANLRDRGVIGPSQSRKELMHLLQTSSNALTYHGTAWQLTADHDPMIGWMKIGHP